MGSSESASQLLNYWIGQHNSDFDAQASSSFEATIAHSIQQVDVAPGICSCKLLVTPRLQNNYGTMNGGGMSALTCIIGGAALQTLGARSGIVTSNSMHCLRAVPAGAIVEVIGRVCTVTSSTAAVDVIVQDSISHKLIAKARYTEQAPSSIKARANAYFNSAATAAKSAVHRVQNAAEHALQRSDSMSGAQLDSDRGLDIRHKAMTSLTSARETLRAAAHRAQLAAESMIPSSASSSSSAIDEAADTSTDNAQGASSPESQAAAQAGTAAVAVSHRLQAAAHSAANAVSPEQPAAPKPAQPPQQDTETQAGANSDLGDSPTSSFSAAYGSASERAKRALLQRVGMVTHGFREDDCTCFDTTLGCTLQDIRVGEGHCAAALPTSARLSDQYGHLHAGCYCSLVDLISTTALASVENRTAVSVTIAVDFYAPLAIGQELLVESRMVKAGKTLTFAEVDFRQKSTGDLVAQGTHVEYPAGGDPYPGTIEEYHKLRVARQKSKL